MNVTQLLAPLLRAERNQKGLSVARLSVLLDVYQHGESQLMAIQKRLGYLPAHLTKLVYSWADIDHRKRIGPGFLTSDPDPMNRVHRLANITPSGRAFVKDLLRE